MPSAARNVGNMADFEREFRVRNLIKLEQNYRSDGNILNAANALIANNARRLGKELWTEAGEGEPVRIYEAQTDGYEAAWLVDEVKGLIAEGHTRSEIAVLYRSNAQSRVIEHALFNSAIPYRVYGGLRFFERAGDQARARLPAADREPERRHGVPAGGQFSAARHRRAHRWNSWRMPRGRGNRACMRRSAA